MILNNLFRIILNSIFAFELENMKRDLTLKQRFIALFLVVLFIGYIGNVNFFAHEHKVGDVVVVHSHMGSSSHGHTVAAISTIFSISHYDTTPIVAQAIMEVVEQLMCEILDRIEFFCYAVKAEYFLLRAPPVL